MAVGSGKLGRHCETRATMLRVPLYASNATSNGINMCKRAKMREDDRTVAKGAPADSEGFDD